MTCLLRGIRPASTKKQHSLRYERCLEMRTQSLTLPPIYFLLEASCVSASQPVNCRTVLTAAFTHTHSLTLLATIALIIFSLTLQFPCFVCISSRPLAESIATSPGTGWLLQVQLSKCRPQIPINSFDPRNSGFVTIAQVLGMTRGLHVSSTSPHICEEEEGNSYWKLPVLYSDVPQESFRT